MDEPKEIVVDKALSKSIKRIAAKLVRRHCPRSVEPADVAQLVMMDLARKPLKYDASKGAKLETLLHTIVYRRALKCAEDARRMKSRFPQFSEKRPPAHVKAKAKRVRLRDILEALDDEASRELCRAYVMHDGNASLVAKELKVTEGTVRYRLQALGPRLIKAGFGKEDLSSNRREDE